MEYSESFKENAVAKLLAPGSKGLSAVSRSLDIPPSTLYGWKKKCANNIDMTKSKEKSIVNWSAEQKLEAVIKTASMPEHDLGEYLRANGLHSSNLEDFRRELISSVPSKGRPKLEPEIVELRKANKMLTRDLKRNTTALAEQSARIILLKKSHEIWGVKEDEE